MLTQHLSLVFMMAWVLAITSLFASGIGLVLAPQLAKIMFLPGPIIVPFVIVLGSAGIVFFGVVGLVMKPRNYSLPSAIVGFILGGIADKNLYLTERSTGGDS